jgi:hypothetical protein
MRAKPMHLLIWWIGATTGYVLGWPLADGYKAMLFIGSMGIAGILNSLIKEKED